MKRGPKVYGPAHLDGDGQGAVRVTLARWPPRRVEGWSGPRLAAGAVVLLAAPDGPTFALPLATFSLAALRAAARDPRTSPGARRALNRWRRALPRR